MSSLSAKRIRILFFSVSSVSSVLKDSETARLSTRSVL